MNKFHHKIAAFCRQEVVKTPSYIGMNELFNNKVYPKIWFQINGDGRYILSGH